MVFIIDILILEPVAKVIVFLMAYSVGCKQLLTDSGGCPQVSKKWI